MLQQGNRQSLLRHGPRLLRLGELPHMLRCWSDLQQEPLLRFWCAVVRHCMLPERQLLLR